MQAEKGICLYVPRRDYLMNMVEKEVVVKDLVTKSNLPASDYVINPYVGCPHGCRYCYACFMKRFTNHSEAWGSFIDIKRCDKPISKKKNWQRLMLNQLKTQFHFLNFKEIRFMPSVTILLVADKL